MTERRVVLVEWEDASDDGETWVSTTTPPPPTVVVHQQVGWLIEKTKKHILLTSTIGPEMMGSRTRIPRGMVRSITTLKKGR